MTDRDAPAAEAPEAPDSPAETATPAPPGPAAPESASTGPEPVGRDPRARLFKYVLPGAVVAGGLVLTAITLLDGDPDPVKVKLPQPPSEVRADIDRVCRDLQHRLPDKVLDAGTRKTVPDSDLIAAWGDPAIVLRCGVPTPVSLRPDDPRYDPEQNAAGVNGVNWTFTFLGEGKGVRFTTLHREVNIEVTVPAKYGQPTGPLTALAEPVKQTVPATMGEG
ncbi:DUF3515 domain-containing protein [Yinghuangia sp. YIM S09857]|uniref:DUF3515 domain-containing protein n=1 Tax=Yinghuangia sp. YIM S09857 TaxID=3436929 RepID=UPI003F537093